MHSREKYSNKQQYRESPGAVLICPETELLTQLLTLIEQHYRYQHNQTYYCNKLGTTYYYLNSRTQYHLSKTVHELVMERLYQESCKLITGTLMSVKTITYELGFSDPSNFNRFFKRHAGMTALEFRAAASRH